MSNGEIRWFEETGRGDVASVGGKNASLGEMVRTLSAKGIQVPGGFATTADAYWRYVDENDLRETIAQTLAEMEFGRSALAEAGQAIRSAILGGTWPASTAAAITEAYRELCERSGRPDVDVAVRSSATAEDLPDASFAGQQETFLNIRGEEALLEACRARPAAHPARLVLAPVARSIPGSRMRPGRKKKSPTPG